MFRRKCVTLICRMSRSSRPTPSPWSRTLSSWDSAGRTGSIFGQSHTQEVKVPSFPAHVQHVSPQGGSSVLPQTSLPPYNAKKRCHTQKPQCGLICSCDLVHMLCKSYHILLFWPERQWRFMHFLCSFFLCKSVKRHVIIFQGTVGPLETNPPYCTELKV